MEFTLDDQLAAGLRGDFVTGQAIADRLAIETPNDPRAMFNRGWYELHKGNLSEGHRLMDAGRSINVFGNRHIGSTKPIWDGQKIGTVLLSLEGGLGDQIHGYRYAKEIEKRGSKVVVSCSPGLASIFAEQSITVREEAALGVCHDYWLPSLSAPSVLDWNFDDVRGRSYINGVGKPIPNRIGLRWSGNPEFEHQQHRLFPPELMFDAVEGFKCVSLQRDAGIEKKPKGMPQADVSDWEATKKSILDCDLVISSCTSVAHLSAAMGVPTWIVVPILPYFLWAFPGLTTPYYESARLFRQREYGCWKHPFATINHQLGQERV